MDQPKGSTKLVSAPVTNWAEPREHPPLDKPGITLIVRNEMTPLTLPETATGRVTLGRFDPDSTHRPDIDLTAFGAVELGVSRLHAAIDRVSGVLALIDLGSRNGTFINGVRLRPDEAYALHQNDVICLGKLVIYVSL